MPNYVECNKRRKLGGVKITCVLGYGTIATSLLIINGKATKLSP
jgi:hypothetical protein